MSGAREPYIVTRACGHQERVPDDNVPWASLYQQTQCNACHAAEARLADDGAPGLTFSQLIDHLDDLTELAEHEGYRTLAAHLRWTSRVIRRGGAAYGRRSSPPAP